MSNREKSYTVKICAGSRMRELNLPDRDIGRAIKYALKHVGAAEITAVHAWEEPSDAFLARHPNLGKPEKKGNSDAL